MHLAMERRAELPEKLPASVRLFRPQALQPCRPCPGWAPPLPLALGLLSCALSLPRDSALGQLEHPMGTVEVASRSGPKRPSFLEGSLLLLLLLATGALVALGLLYAHSRGEYGHPPVPPHFPLKGVRAAHPGGEGWDPPPPVGQAEVCAGHRGCRAALRPQ